MREALAISLEHNLQQQAAQSYANLTEYYADRVPVGRNRAGLPRSVRLLRRARRLDVRQLRPGPLRAGTARPGPLGRGAASRPRRRSPPRLADQPADLADHRWAGARSTRLPTAIRFLAEAEAVGPGVDETAVPRDGETCRAEAAWLDGDPDAARARLAAVRPRLTPLEAKETAAVIAWERRLGVPTDDVPALAAVRRAGVRAAAPCRRDLGRPRHAVPRGVGPRRLHGTRPSCGRRSAGSRR